MKPITALVVALAFTNLSFAESLRCGNKLVDPGTTMEQVRQFCGKPSSSSVEEQDVRSGNRVVGKTEVHTWRYRRGAGQNTAVLVFDQDKLKSITYESK
jgi:hypothetical protein